jgi:LPS export ABC transporter protein LptC
MKKFGYILLLLCFAIFGCDAQESSTINPENRVLPDQEGWNSTVRVTKNGRPTVIVRYGHMQKFASKKYTQFDDGIVLNFYNSRGDCTSVLTAESGMMYDLRNDFEAMGNVVVISKDGRTLRTEKLRWDENEQKILTDEFVTITTAEGDTLTGQGFESDQSLNFWKINKPTGVTSKAFTIDELEQEAAEDTLRQ